MKEWFLAGGWVMYPLILCSFVTVFVMVERFLFFSNWRKQQEPLKIAEVQKMFETHQFEEIKKYVQDSKDIRLQTLSDALSQPNTSVIEKNFQITTQKAQGEMRRFLSTLETLLTSAPMLGILGTVSGIIRTFKSLSWDQPDAQTLAMAGLSEALITTEFGLVIAIPCAFLAAYILRESDRWAGEMDRMGNKLEISISNQQAVKKG